VGAVTPEGGGFFRGRRCEWGQDDKSHRDWSQSTFAEIPPPPCRLMMPNATKRLTAPQALEHPWVKGESPHCPYMSHSTKASPMMSLRHRTPFPPFPARVQSFLVGPLLTRPPCLALTGLRDFPAGYDAPFAPTHSNGPGCMKEGPCRQPNGSGGVTHTAPQPPHPRPALDAKPGDATDPISAAPVELRLGLLVKIQV
jgi:hypothetical protein